MLACMGLLGAAAEASVEWFASRLRYTHEHIKDASEVWLSRPPVSGWLRGPRRLELTD